MICRPNLRRPLTSSSLGVLCFRLAAGRPRQVNKTATRQNRRTTACRLEIVRRRLARAPVRDNIVRDLLTFVEVAHPGAPDSADVNENVGPAVKRRRFWTAC
jgi:hypothetical protein